MTVFKTATLIYKFYYKRLNFFEKNLLVKLLDGILGLGDVPDEVVVDYLTQKQIKWVKKLGKKFRIK